MSTNLPKSTPGGNLLLLALVAASFQISEGFQSSTIQRPLCHPIVRSNQFHCTSSRLFAEREDEELYGAHLKKVDHALVETEDPIQDFVHDVESVLKLRPDRYDPTIPKVNHIPLSFTNSWTVNEWKSHRSRWRFLRYLRTLPTSRLLRRMTPQLSVLAVWSVIACRLGTRVLFPVSLTSLSLVSTFVAALLTLRNNQGLARLSEARNAMGILAMESRDLSQFLQSNVYSKSPDLTLRAVRHVALFPWLLKGYLRGVEVNGSDEDIIRALLPPVSRKSDELSSDAAYILDRKRKRPAAAISRLRQIVSYWENEQHVLTVSECHKLDVSIEHLNKCIAIAERIQSSPIPPVYTAHTGRLVMFYLFLLPFALQGLLESSTASVAAKTVAIAFAMLGLDEISHMTEEPFRLMPLYHISKYCMKDSGDAFACAPPPLFSNDDAVLHKREPPSYWNDTDQ